MIERSEEEEGRNTSEALGCKCMAHKKKPRLKVRFEVLVTGLYPTALNLSSILLHTIEIYTILPRGH